MGVAFAERRVLHPFSAVVDELCGGVMAYNQSTIFVFPHIVAGIALAFCYFFAICE